MYKKLLISIFAVILAAFPLLSIIFMPRTVEGESPFSENENRYLATFPLMSLDRLINKNFMNGFDKWVSDSFLVRENWIILKNETEKMMGKTEINGVYTADDRMIQSWSEYDREATDKTLMAMENFAQKHSEIPVYFMLVPTAQEIYSDTLPGNAPVRNQKNYIKYCFDMLPTISGIDVNNVLVENRERYIYYRTDHHWTSLGAYLAYAATAPKMGYTAVSFGEFNIERASSNFKGTLFSKTLDFNVTPDIIDFYVMSSGDPGVNVSITNGENTIEYESMYFKEYLDKKDKYSAFLGTNAPVMEIKSELPDNDKKLLIFKDSYAHCLIPFYAKNYSTVTVLDMRYINVDYNTLVDIDEYDQILFIYNVITFSEDTNLRKLG